LADAAGLDSEIELFLLIDFLLESLVNGMPAVELYVLTGWIYFRFVV
jgi:hypothetical protein